ncbi:MAG: chemotaxis protein CheX [Candidatus Omnitrophica bacterium]|nr:chemotaxis protein CheX [Candidatus Omnitrophota bacterium]
MTDQVQETLVQVLESMLEQYAFAFCELAPKNELETEEVDFVHSLLTFTGSRTGEIALTMPAELCEEIAGNILGGEMDNGELSEYAQDSLKELLNIYAGNVLTSLYGDEVSFDFDAPEIRNLDRIGWQSLIDDPLTIGVLVEDTPALLRFSARES